MFKKLAAVLAGAALIMAAASAMAVPISGNSTSSLTPGVAQSTVQQLTGISDQVYWGTPQSTLTTGTNSGNFIINQNYEFLGGNDVKLASLTWVNNDNLNTQQPNTILNAATWAITLNLSDPSGVIGPTSNVLNLSLNKNSGLDKITLQNVSGLSRTFGDFLINDFHYIVTDSGLVNPQDEWTSRQGETGTLYLVADFTKQVAPVPEPGTMVLLGAGLLGLAIFGKRRMNA